MGPRSGRSLLRVPMVHSVSKWNAWPATGRSALKDLRSCAILQASLALSPVSSSICCTHVRQGRPRWRFHSGLMSRVHVHAQIRPCKDLDLAVCSIYCDLCSPSLKIYYLRLAEMLQLLTESVCHNLVIFRPLPLTKIWVKHWLMCAMFDQSTS